MLEAGDLGIREANDSDKFCVHSACLQPWF